MHSDFLIAVTRLTGGIDIKACLRHVTFSRRNSTGDVRLTLPRLALSTHEPPCQSDYPPCGVSILPPDSGTPSAPCRLRLEVAGLPPRYRPWSHHGAKCARPSLP